MCSPGIALLVFAGQTRRSAPTVVGVFTPPSQRFACATSSINRGGLKYLYFTLNSLPTGEGRGGAVLVTADVPSAVIECQGL